ncbi:MAG: radical SAM protein [Candidatus Bathyarchaeota archaeon]|nr:radical SAM protein [Candidatus Termiticorpusculum sp.]
MSISSSSSSFCLPSQIRVSLGTAICLGLLDGKIAVNPTTAYLMTYIEGKCSSNCSFCPQARHSQSSADMLSRVTWPIFPLYLVTAALADAIKKGKIRRVCIQALNAPNMFLHLEALVKEIKKHDDIPVSVSCQPLSRQNIELLKNAQVDRIGIALDAATETIFRKIKGDKARNTYSWQSEIKLLKDALSIFGADHVSTHLIVGLGETEKDLTEIIQWCVNFHILPALFAFTPIRGTALERQSQPSITSYRRLQLVRYLIVHGITCLEQIHFNTHGEIVSFGVTDDTLTGIIESGKPFQTSGCPYCNRPFYNEKPGGMLYNYPKSLNIKDVGEIKKQLGLF